MKISPNHSIARVKQTYLFACNFKTRRAAQVRIACLKWLGRW